MHGKRHRLRKLRGETAYVDASPARLHIASLMGAGWSLRSIAGTAKVPTTTVSNILRLKGRTARPETIQRILAVRIDQIAETTEPARKTPAEPFVPRTGTVRRIQALLWMGWTHEDMLQRCGVRTSVALAQQGRWVTRTKHDKVARLFDELWDRPGPSERTRERARRRGYHGPLAWDDIDHDLEPLVDMLAVEAEGEYLDEVAIQRRMDGDKSVALTVEEKTELRRRWLASGRSLNEMERVTGVNSGRHKEEAEAEREKAS